MALNTYNPKEVSVIVAGQIISGYADGSFVSVERDEDTFALQIGADGEGTRSKSNNRAGVITITLQQGSPSNAVLSAIAQADELTSDQIFPVLVKDNSGLSIHSAETCWIQKPTNAEYAREAGDREWTLRTDALLTFTGGNG